MKVVMTISGDTAADELLSLDNWLAEERLNAEAHLVRHPPKPGSLSGLSTHAIMLDATHGIAMALASVVIAWIRRRVGDLTLKMTRPDGTSFDMTARHVRGLDETALRTLVMELQGWLEYPASTTDVADVASSEDKP